ncbi:type II toxin-antitoxin system mRNA interferase toxin, RelE/StbE family [Candidatus Daviesbacteria bacterium]|nr:type II toxin-antitoxin system mRNA interferase toxin, RelE/StbE family [Candidatus Daviesbacteria bacterium]
MKIKFYKQFVKHLTQRVKPNPSLLKKCDERIALFIKNPKDPLLKDHKLIGRKEDFRAFSITGDIRIIYRQGEDYIYFIDIGSHNQVY